ncbi:MAG TPA: PfkB family carbohydrate kinase [Pseudonocardiaceae bacterium]|nr:PfkB family carbohydrate kinase [Pseudonocardiaceae bacterium]
MVATGPSVRLVHVGSVLIDIVMYVPHLPERGGDVIATGSQLVAGGGLNVMVSAARQGLPTAYGGLHGTGPFGDLTRAALRAGGIEILQPRYHDEDTGYDVALVEDSAERTFATHVGAEGRLSSADLARLVVRGTDFVYVSGYGLVHAANGPALAGWLRGLDPTVTVILDPGPLVAEIPRRILDPVLDRTDWCSCNQREARALTGTGDPFAAVRSIARLTRAGALVRIGRDGCVLAGPNQAPEEIGGFRVDAVDSNGAGDAHAGAFLAGLAAGLTPGAAALRANAAAAIAVTRRGPTSAPDRCEVDAFLAGHTTTRL